MIANDTPMALKRELGSTVIELDMGEPTEAERSVGILSQLPTGHVERDGVIVRLTTEDGAHLLMETLRALDAAGLAPLHLAAREPSLDDVFLALTGHRAEATDEPETSPTAPGAA